MKKNKNTDNYLVFLYEIYKSQSKKMLNRIAYRLKDGALSLMLAGLLLTISSDYRVYGVYLIIASVVFYLFFKWLYNQTIPNRTYDVDENGNVKKKYR